MIPNPLIRTEMFRSLLVGRYMYSRRVARGRFKGNAHGLWVFPLMFLLSFPAHHWLPARAKITGYCSLFSSSYESAGIMRLSSNFQLECLLYPYLMKNYAVWDVGGQDKIRPLWRHYYQNTQGLIFVVDSNDRDRVDAARDELHRMLNEDELRESILLVFANKQVCAVDLCQPDVVCAWPPSLPCHAKAFQGCSDVCSDSREVSG